MVKGGTGWVTHVWAAERLGVSTMTVKAMLARGDLVRRPGAGRGRLKRGSTPLPEFALRRVLNESTGRLRAYLLLAYLAGLRAHEIAKFRGEHITETHLYVLGKGARPATIPTHPALWASPRSTRAAARGSPPAARTSRSPPRRSVIRGGSHIRVVQELMRLSSLATAEHYLAATEDEQRAGILGLAA